MGETVRHSKTTMSTIGSTENADSGIYSRIIFLLAKYESLIIPLHFPMRLCLIGNIFCL